MDLNQRLFNRLTEVEKIKIRCAQPVTSAEPSPQLHYLANSFYLSDLPGCPESERAAILQEVAALCHLEMSVKGAELGFGRTWTV